jgi:DNA-binding NarL/FixJ family response regulator
VTPELARLGVTAREAEILHMVNAGLTNADIASRLFISIRTVETHVSSLLRKSGADSRDELPAVVPVPD